MSENCNHDCANCSANCGERTDPQSLQVPTNEFSKVRRVIAVVSGKGGVGKSLVTSLLASETMRRGYTTAILDADITGPSIPKAFGIKERVTGNDLGFFPVKSEKGMPVMSLNLMVDDETTPALWRGPIIASVVTQFWTDTVWGDLDYLYVDMPPGTGDVPLTVFQSLPIAGIVIVTTPQELVGMIVDKAYNMAKMMNIPVLALVENMSYLSCPDCGKEIEVFGPSRVEETAKRLGIENFARIPIDSALASACDRGEIENYEGDWLNQIVSSLEF